MSFLVDPWIRFMDSAMGGRRASGARAVFSKAGGNLAGLHNRFNFESLMVRNLNQTTRRV
jgi:hypothetical protein